jgi:hypothetical protein
MRSWSHSHSVPLVTGEIGVFEERLQPDRENSLAGSPIWLQMGTRFDFVRENHLDRFPGDASPILQTYLSPDHSQLERFTVESWQRLHLDRKHGRKIANHGRPAVSGIG